MVLYAIPKARRIVNAYGNQWFGKGRVSLSQPWFPQFSIENKDIRTISTFPRDARNTVVISQLSHCNTQTRQITVGSNISMELQGNMKGGQQCFSMLFF